MSILKLKLTADSDLLLHSDRGANPLAADTVAHKALTNKRKKTDVDHIEIAKSEYMLGFYQGDTVQVPTTNIKASITNGAKLNKLGAAFSRAVMMTTEMTPINFKGPKTKEGLWASERHRDCRSVKVGTARLMRYRPRLPDWSIEVEIFFDEDMIEAQQIITAAEKAGRYIGLGDYRPEKGGVFGRYSVEVVGVS